MGDVLHEVQALMEGEEEDSKENIVSIVNIYQTQHHKISQQDIACDISSSVRK